MTGDGIYISERNDNTEYVSISNCNISNNRRQGITIITGKRIDIFQNEIHDIEGIAPRIGIDLEPNEVNQTIEDVNIYENKLYTFASLKAIELHNNIYRIKIYANELYGKIMIYDSRENVDVYNNNITDGGVYAIILDKYIETHEMKNVTIENNYLKNSKIALNRSENVKVISNNIEDGNIAIINSDVELIGNTIVNTGELPLEYAILYRDTENKKIFKENNIVQGIFDQIEKIEKT